MGTLKSDYYDAGGGAVGFRPDPSSMTRAELANLAGPEAATMSGISHSLDRAAARLEASKKEPNRISQGVDGSCFFLAPLQSLQNSDPETMAKMITDNKNGTHTVKLPGLDKPITVNEPTDAEMANWANSKSAAIMEKAFSEYYTKDYPFAKENGLNQDSSKIPSARIHGGITSDAMKLLTGKEPTKLELEGKSDEDLRAALTSGSEKGAAMTADTNDYVRTSTGLVGRHSYSATYNAATDTVTLQNPIKPDLPNSNKSSSPFEPFNPDGTPKDGRDDGTFELPVSEFKKHFANVTFVK
jgi:hypothetical protein